MPRSRLLFATFILIGIFFLPLFPFETKLPCPFPPCPDLAEIGDAYDWINSRDPWKGPGKWIFVGEIFLALLLGHGVKKLLDSIRPN